MNLKKLTSDFWMIIVVATWSLFSTACTETETTDSTSFAIYYTGMTDIGPSMVGTISKPTYKGPAPSDFAITGITLNEEAYSGDCFEINSESGEISILNTKDASTGRYKISVSCMAGGKAYNFPNIVVVKLLAAAPEGIVTTPNFLKADYGDVLDINSIADMPTAIVTTEGEHISITSYKIGAVELVVNEDGSDTPSYSPLDEKYKECFSISAEGKFSIVQGEISEKLEPATYCVSLILGTKVQETMLERAIKVQITSKPLALTYPNNYGKIEEKTNADPTTFKSVIPTFKGSTDGLKFSIYSVSPQTDKIKINEKNGQIYVEDGHGFKKGEIYMISVVAKNMYNTEDEIGKVFSEVFTLETVDFIKPITKFSYSNNGEAIKKVELSRFSITPEIEGDEVLFSSANYPDVLKNNGVTFNKNNGTITAIKGNKVPKGKYTFAVTAENTKGKKTIDVTLDITDNPNMFTYIHYGNNLGANGTELEGNEYQNQFRFYSNTFSSTILEAVTDYKGDKSSLKWSTEMIRFIEPAASYPKEDGTIRFKNWKDNNLGIMLVTATAGDDPDTQVSVTVPVFLHMLKSPAYQIEYTPLVLHVNPKTGGSSETPKISTKGAELTPDQRSKFILDYRRVFTYYNFGGKRADGTLHEDGRPDAAPISKFMQNLWDKCDASYGSKSPLSYYNGSNQPKTDWKSTLGYVDNGSDTSKRYSVNVIPNQWDDAGWANGFLVGAMTYTTDGIPANVNSGTEINAFIIWFDENYQNK